VLTELIFAKVLQPRCYERILIGNRHLWRGWISFRQIST